MAISLNFVFSPVSLHCCCHCQSPVQCHSLISSFSSLPYSFLVTRAHWYRWVVRSVIGERKGERELESGERDKISAAGVTRTSCRWNGFRLEMKIPITTTTTTTTITTLRVTNPNPKINSNL